MCVYYIYIVSAWFNPPESDPLYINMLISMTGIHQAHGYLRGPWINPLSTHHYKVWYGSVEGVSEKKKVMVGGKMESGEAT